MSHSRVTEADLHAYVDGRMSARRCLDIETYLATRPAETLQVCRYQAQRRTIQLSAGGAVEDTVPPYLIQSAIKHTGAEPRLWVTVLVAVLGLVILGGLLGLTVQGALRAGACDASAWKGASGARLSPSYARDPLPLIGAARLRSSTDRLAG